MLRRSGIICPAISSGFSCSLGVFCQFLFSFRLRDVLVLTPVPLRKQTIIFFFGFRENNTGWQIDRL